MPFTTSRTIQFVILLASGAGTGRLGAAFISAGAPEGCAALTCAGEEPLASVPFDDDEE